MSCCKQSFEICEPIPACIQQLVIKTPVISAQVTIRLIDKFNKIYYVTKISDSDGNITIQLVEDRSDLNNIILADLPDSLLNEYAGQFKIMAINSTGDNQQWTISGTQYDALIIEVASITPVVDSYTIDSTYADGKQGTFNL